MADEVSLLVKFTASEGQEDGLESALKALVEPSRAEAGNRYYDLYRTSEPSVFVIHESWQDRSAFGAHTASAGFKRFAALLEGLLIGPYEVLNITKIQ